MSRPGSPAEHLHGAPAANRSDTRARPIVYLDYNANAPVRPAVMAAVSRCLAQPGNPSSVHAAGRRAHGWLEEARAQVAAAVGADPAAVVFTGGGTEANHLALAQAAGRVAVSAIEHPSILETRQDAVRLPVNADGVLDLEEAQRLVHTEQPALASVMLANNETGVIQPIAELARICRRAGVLLHVDAVQGLGKLAIDLAALGADLLTLSAHKLGGPPGVGALVHRPSLDLRPVLRGGGQELHRRAGTQNLAGIVGFAAALTTLDPAEPIRMRRLLDRLETRIGEAVVIGQHSPRLPNTSCLLLPGLRAETQLMALDLDSVMVSAGAACSSGKIGPSHVLTAMGLGSAEASSAIRVSLGWASTETDVDRFVASYSKLATLAARPRLPT